jgi:hypothetical protein
MRRILLLLTVAVVMAAMMVASAMPAFAHTEMDPCVQTSEPGHSEYAQHHIVPLVGQESDHNPGLHQGFSACDPSENRP